MERKESSGNYRMGSRLAVILFVAVTTFGFVSESLAANSPEEVVKIVQNSKYNIVTGNWDVELRQDASEVAQLFRDRLPKLDYHLVEEELAMKSGNDRIVMTFRGEGDQRVVVKLKESGGSTNVRVRVGLVGSEAKSVELFKYVFSRI